jgi:RHS repeat-associated protein
MPSVRLDYNSYAGNGICGVGWSLEFLSIKRQTDKGFPEYNGGDTFVFQGEEVVPLATAGQDWRCENERNFQRLRQIDSDSDGLPDAWEVTERNGTKHTLGRFRGQNNRWSVVEHPEKTAASPFDRTYSWIIDSTTDLHGNTIEYEYIRGTGVLYPSRISYSHLAGASHEVLFQYEDRPDAFDDYRPTFSARLDRRLKRIEVRSQGQLVRAYNLGYSYDSGDLPPDLAALQSSYLDLGVTLLKRVVQVDRSGSDANFLPPLIFAYSGLDLTKAELRALASSPDLDLADPSGRVQLADLDGDALPDLFSTTAAGAAIVQQVCLNRGESRAAGVPKVTFAPAKQVLASSPVDLAQTNAVIHDPKGKGLVDLSCLLEDGPNKRLEIFGNRARLDVVSEDRLGFSRDNLETNIMPNPPAFVSYSQAGTRQEDINFDKKGDFVNLEPGFGAMKVNTYYLDRAGEWVSGESMLPSSYPLANTFAGPDGQPNPCVHLADMNGDRMLDLVCLAPVQTGNGQRISVSYWPLCGLGRYADERTMTPTAPDTFDIGAADLRDVFIDDFTGDGLADVIVLDGSGSEAILTLRVNIAGKQWSAPYVRTGLPRYAPRDSANPTIVRVADLNANGSLDLFFRNTAPQSSYAYLELLPTGKPSLVTHIDNSLGKRTTISYGSAAEDEQRARESGHPWRTHSPVALQVVRQIRTSGGLDLNGDSQEDTVVAEFRYRDPFYDGLEREFRGFAFAQRIDYGDDSIFDPATGLMKASTGWNQTRTPTGQISGPSLVTRYRFHTGAADQVDNDDYGAETPNIRLIDEVTAAGGREEEVLKGLQIIEEKVDPVVLYAAPDGDFDAGCEAASTGSTEEARGKLTPDAYTYTRSRQEWTVRRLYRPAEALPYVADQNSDGIFEDYRSSPLPPVPAGRFAAQGAVVVPGNGRSVSYAFVSKSVTEVREANGLLSSALGYPSAPALQTLKTMDYDDYGNQILEADFGIDGGDYDDERVTTTTYAHGGNALSLWVIDKPETTSVTDEAGAFVSKKTHFYDGNPLEGIQGEIQNRALLHRIIEYIDPNQSIQAIRRRYDEYGNVTETQDPVGDVRRIAWDPVFQTYAVREAIVVGGGSPDLILNAEYDYGFGVVTKAIDFNDNITTYGYDSFARLVKIVRPGDTPTQPTLSFEYQPVDPTRGRGFVYDTAGKLTLATVPLGAASRVITRQREIAGQEGEFLTASFTDGLGNTLATIEEGEAPNTWIVKTANSYNLRRIRQSKWLPFQISSVGLPQFATIWPSGRPPTSEGVSPAVVSTDIYYDPTGREIRSVAAPETWGGPRRETVTQYLPFQKRLFDEEDLLSGSQHFATPHTEHSDGLNRLIAVEETARLTDFGLPGPLTNWLTEYAYDLNDQLIRVRDSQGNTKTMAFDGLKRVTSMNDPDRGRTTFVYDDASNLRETVDAKGQRITYTYDGVNRIKTEDYHDTGPRAPDVEYFYDTPQSNLDLGDGTRGVANNTKGQLAFVRDLSGETHLSYDARARIEWELKRIPDRVHGQLVSFRTRFGYDSADRLEQVVYPDGDQITHDYNSRNLLSRVFGASLGDVIASVSYRPSGQLSAVKYGDGLNTAYNYDPRLRLSNIQTTNKAGERLLDFSYGFDGANNIERIEDRRNLVGLRDATNRFNTQVFTYDDLYRLTRADYPPLASGKTNHIDYSYDRIGNMLAQTSNIPQEVDGLPMVNLGVMDSGGAAGRFNRRGRDANDAAGPHALTRITGAGKIRDYTYDANGNITLLDGLKYEWDFKDRLVAVENEQMRAVYTYDYTDRRITKTVHWKNVTPDKGSEVSSLNPAWRSTSTHYINRYFEIREHDAVVKFVWNGDTRVARVTATLGTAALVQRLRINAGWNLVALRVGGQFPVLSPANNADVGACVWFSGGPADNGFVYVTGTTPIPAGATLWIYGLKAMTLVLVGTPAPQELAMLTGVSQFLGNVLAEPIDIATVFPASAWLKQYDPATTFWRNRFPPGLGLEQVNNASAFVSPGEAIWTTGASPGRIGGELNAVRIRYYHQDHLGSSCLVTDSAGLPVTEMANYPFGMPRNVFQSLDIGEKYQFNGKELDIESGLECFGARYYWNVAGRWVSADTKPVVLRHLHNPQKLNRYSYVVNSPVNSFDPDGMEEVTIQLNAFIQKENVGGFRGDNRSFRPRMDASSRVSVTVKVETDPAKNLGKPMIGKPDVRIGVTHLNLTGSEKTSSGPQMPTVTVTQDKNGMVTVNVQESMRNPFQLVGPGIRANLNIAVNQEATHAYVNGSISRTPSFEANFRVNGGEVKNLPLQAEAEGTVAFVTGLGKDNEIDKPAQLAKPPSKSEAK